MDHDQDVDGGINSVRIGGQLAHLVVLVQILERHPGRLVFWEWLARQGIRKRAHTHDRQTAQDSNHRFFRVCHADDQVGDVVFQPFLVPRIEKGEHRMDIAFHGHEAHVEGKVHHSQLLANEAVTLGPFLRVRVRFGIVGFNPHLAAGNQFIFLQQVLHLPGKMRERHRCLRAAGKEKLQGHWSVQGL